MFISFMQFGFAAVKGKLGVWSCSSITGSPEPLTPAPARTPEAASLDSSCFAAFWSPLPCLSIPCRECRGAGGPRAQDLAQNWRKAGPQGHPLPWACHLPVGSWHCAHREAQGFADFKLSAIASNKGLTAREVCRHQQQTQPIAARQERL